MNRSVKGNSPARLQAVLLLVTSVLVTIGAGTFAMVRLNAGKCPASAPPAKTTGREKESKMETTITKANFEQEVLRSDKPVLVDFWAPWCGPCRMLSPIVEEIATERATTLRVAKINVDEAPELAAQFGITSIPTLLLFRNGKVAGTSVGYVSKTDLLLFVDKHAGSSQ